MINPLISHFLWGGVAGEKKISKVSLKVCMLSKQQGGLGLMDIRLMSTKMAAKWIIRALDSLDYWAFL